MGYPLKIIPHNFSQKDTEKCCFCCVVSVCLPSTESSHSQQKLSQRIQFFLTVKFLNYMQNCARVQSLKNEYEPEMALCDHRLASRRKKNTCFLFQLLRASEPAKKFNHLNQFWLNTTDIIFSPYPHHVYELPL